MFKRGWLRRGTIYSDEGFSVAISDRTHLVYRQGGKAMTVAGELLANGFVIHRVTIGPWDNGTPVDDKERVELASNIRRALESQGMSVDFD